MRILRSIWRLAAGLTAVGVLGALLTQADRFVIGAQLPLADLGYYTLAMTATGPLPLVAAAIAAAVLPQFSSQLARKEAEGLATTYRQAFDATAYIAIWGALPLIFFSHAVLYLWTRSHTVANAGDAVLTLLSLAYLVNALFAIPYTLLLATGRTKVPLLVNGISVPIVAVVTYLLVPSVGLVGAAAIWLAVMGVHLIIYGGWVHRFLLPGGFLVSLAGPGIYAVSGAAIFFTARLAADHVSDGSGYAIAFVAFALSGALGLRLLPTDLREATISMLRRSGRKRPSVEEPLPVAPDGIVQPKV
jgi:O-antigen/teichoic acid export membrane protein